MSGYYGTVCQVIIFIVVIVILAIILQYIFNPKKNPITRKYMEIEKENPPIKENNDATKEKEFYKQIWNDKKSER